MSVGNARAISIAMVSGAVIAADAVVAAFKARIADLAMASRTNRVIHVTRPALLPPKAANATTAAVAAKANIVKVAAAVAVVVVVVADAIEGKAAVAVAAITVATIPVPKASKVAARFNRPNRVR
jgi:hypothetical protein